MVSKMIIESITSWLINAGIMAVIAAEADKKRGYIIEKHQLLGFFLVFIIPTVLEIISQSIAHKAFIWWVLGM